MGPESWCLSLHQEKTDCKLVTISQCSRGVGEGGRPETRAAVV